MKASARTFPDHKGNQTLQCNVIQVCDSQDYRNIAFFQMFLQYVLTDMHVFGLGFVRR